MSDPLPWKVSLICCGYEAGTICFSTWKEADAFREAYCTGPGVGVNGHNRAGVISMPSTDPAAPPMLTPCPGVDGLAEDDRGNTNLTEVHCPHCTAYTALVERVEALADELDNLALGQPGMSEAVRYVIDKNALQVRALLPVVEFRRAYQDDSATDSDDEKFTKAWLAILDEHCPRPVAPTEENGE